jgi:PP-loop superfamily ATP-utilizing enzyme
MNYKNPHVQAIDLMLEDLHVKNIEIRTTAKKLGCENELESIKCQLIDYLYGMRE